MASNVYTAHFVHVALLNSPNVLAIVHAIITLSVAISVTLVVKIQNYQL